MNWIVPLAVALVLWGVSFLYLRAYTRRRTDPAVIMAAYADEAERIVATIDAATDRYARLVEERIKTLRAVLEDTDRRLATLSREIERRQREDLSRVQLSAPARQVQDTPPATTTVTPQAAQAAPPANASATTATTAAATATAATAAGATDKGLSGAPAASDVETSEPAFSLPSIRRSERPIQPAPPSFPEQVSALYRKGMSVELIAQTLNAAQAEVEFATALLDSSWKEEDLP